jgi:hypothetical protein
MTKKTKADLESEIRDLRNGIKRILREMRRASSDFPDSLVRNVFVITFSSARFHLGADIEKCEELLDIELADIAERQHRLDLADNGDLVGGR